MHALAAALLLLLAVPALAARTRHYTLNIASGNVAPDGFNRAAVTVNGLTPGQIIYAEKGDTVLVTVTNQLVDPNMRRSTTVHWHGISPPRSAFDDGPAGVTQCPIAPKNSYTYRLALGNQAGTFWYHSHLGSQYIDGLRGAFIVYDPQDPHKALYNVDDPTTVIQLNDWYHQYAGKLADDWLKGFTPEPVPDSNLLNGIGRYSGGPKVPRAVISVTKGKRYRFRLINMSAIIPFKFEIEGHQLTVIEADGINHQPFTVTSLQLSAGQRYSVVVAADQAVANYWVAYPSNFIGLTRTTSNLNYNGTEAFAVLRYAGAPVAEPTTPQITPREARAANGRGMLQEDQLKPLENAAAPGGDKADMVIQLKFQTSRPGFSGLPGIGNKWLVNGVQYKPPAIPTLLDILSGQNKQGAAESVIVLPKDKSIEVQISGDRGHPFHLHGHTFSVIKSAAGARNVVDPPRRDTVVTSADLQNPVTIRFRTDNPGPWLLHCHKDWHLEAGLAVVFAEAPPEERTGAQALKPTAEWTKLCPLYNALAPELQ